MGLNKIVFTGFATLVLLAGGLSVTHLLDNRNNERSQPVAQTPEPTTQPSTPKPKVQGVITAVDNDPIINCTIHANCGGGTTKLKSSICKQSTCCRISGKWFFYESNAKCEQDQKNANNKQGGISNTVSPNYPPCTVFYPLLGYSRTYSYISPSQCSIWQTQASSYSSPMPQPTYAPAPTQDPAYQNLLDQHAEACNQAAAEWIGLREQWETNNFNNYSSSAEAVVALNQYKNQYQQELYDAGCSQTISL